MPDGRATFHQLLSLRVESQDDSPQPSQRLSPGSRRIYILLTLASFIPPLALPQHSPLIPILLPPRLRDLPVPGRVQLQRPFYTKLSCLSDPLPAVVAQSAPTPPLPRKKSGEQIEEHMFRGYLTVITGRVNSGSSRSAPTTPTHKGVRFHSELEHVEYLLAEQKPPAVSCDGSSTDISGTDSEFPLFIHPRDDDLKERPLVMHCIDVPIASSLAEGTCNIAVENIDLVGTTVEGIIRVRNLTFNKCIAVYFTLDNWETTSEVTARYKESFSNSTFDRFIFLIKLADVLSRAQEKTLYLSIRYAVFGREIWDNNGGRNYQVRIVHKKALNVNREAMFESCEESFQDDDINHIMDLLRRQLEQVVKHGYPSEIISGILSHESRRRWDLWGFYPSCRSSHILGATLLVVHSHHLLIPARTQAAP